MKRKPVLALLLAMSVASGSAVTAFAAEPMASVVELGETKNGVVTIDKTAATITVGEKLTLNGDFANKDEIVTEMKWHSSDENVVKVKNRKSLKGFIEGIAPGTATITLTVNGHTASCVVTVKERKVEITDLDKESLNLKVGESYDLTVYHQPYEEPMELPAVWDSTNKDVATVDQNGNVTAVGAGSATITATYDGKTVKCEVTVYDKVIALEKLEMDKKELTLYQKSEEQLNLIYTPENTTVTKQAVWDSSNWSSVSVDQWGGVRTHFPGTAIITAKIGDKVATCKVTVLESTVPVQGVVLNKMQTELKVGETDKLVWSFEPSNATVNLKGRWETSDANVVTVDQEGNIKALKAGTAKIYVYVGDWFATCTVTVTENNVALESITLNKTEVKLVEGNTDKLTVSYNHSNTTVDKTVKWETSDANVVTVDKDGNIKAIKAGTATITANVNGKKATCKVTVAKKEINAGWQSNNVGWWYNDAEGNYVTGWQYIDGAWYYFAVDGYMQTGWQYINGLWYYMSSDGAMQTGWKWIDGSCYYFYGDGHMASNEWIEGSYVNSSGVWVENTITTGWQSNNVGWWYNDAKGNYVTGWKYINGAWYYFATDGYMQTGWQYINGTWYYMSTDGAMQTGWKWIGGSCYYFYGDGHMASDEWIEGSYVNSSGAWVK